jgi:hypothetical protein
MSCVGITKRRLVCKSDLPERRSSVSEATAVGSRRVKRANISLATLIRRSDGYTEKGCASERRIGAGQRKTIERLPVIFLHRNIEFC